MNTYMLPFNAQEIEEKLKLIGQIPDHSQYFNIDNNGLISLKSMYRGYGLSSSKNFSISDNGINFKGTLNTSLPKHLYIPTSMGGQDVKGFQEGTFANNLAIEEITLNNNITILPKFLCYGANYLKNLNNTNTIIGLEKGCIAYTQITSLHCEQLENASNAALQYASYLQEVNIGNKITVLPEQMFYNCISLASVVGGDAVNEIGSLCFFSTRCLKTLPLINKYILGHKDYDNSQTLTLYEQPFFNSRIQCDWSNLQFVQPEKDANNQPADTKYPTPITDNTVRYWELESEFINNIKSYQTPLITKYNQLNATWADAELGNTKTTYSQGCAYFSAMHIHSALSKKYYANPKEFIDELYQNEVTKKYVDQNEYWLGHFHNDITFFQDLGYKIKVLSNYENTDEVFTTEDYKEMCDALAAGAMVFTSCTRSDDQSKNDISNYGHIVTLYGIQKDSNNNIEVCVMDSIAEPAEYRTKGLMSDDLFTYIMPYQNFTGPCPGCIIIYPPKEES